MPRAGRGWLGKEEGEFKANAVNEGNEEDAEQKDLDHPLRLRRRAFDGGVEGGASEAAKCKR